MAKSFDVSQQEYERLVAKAKRRAELREEFLKQSTNPHRHATIEGGTVFDTGLQRFISMKVTAYDHFKPNPRSAIALFAVLVPMIGYTWLIKWERDTKEKRYRNGEVAYRDRRFKFA